MGKFRSTTDVVPAVYKPGERFAQLVIVPYLDVEIEEVAELNDSERGEGGYGSTGNDISAAQDKESSLETETAVTNSNDEPAAEQMSSEQV